MNMEITQEWLDNAMMHVNRKLLEREVKNGDHVAAINALSRCAMAGRLIMAYKIYNGIAI